MKESSIYSSIEEIEHLGHDSNSGNKWIQNSPMKKSSESLHWEIARTLCKRDVSKSTEEPWWFWVLFTKSYCLMGTLVYTPFRPFGKGISPVKGLIDNGD